MSQIQVDYVYDAHKPSAKNYRKAMEIMGTDASEYGFYRRPAYLPMSGGPNVQAIPSVLVKPIHPKEEIQIVLKRLSGEGSSCALMRKARRKKKRLKKGVIYYRMKKANKMISAAEHD